MTQATGSCRCRSRESASQIGAPSGPPKSTPNRPRHHPGIDPGIDRRTHAGIDGRSRRGVDELHRGANVAAKGVIELGRRCDALGRLCPSSLASKRRRGIEAAVAAARRAHRGASLLCAADGGGGNTDAAHRPGRKASARGKAEGTRVPARRSGAPSWRTARTRIPLRSRCRFAPRTED